MKKIVKAFYLLVIAMIVFLGGLLIWEGMTLPRKAPVSVEKTDRQTAIFPSILFYFQEGSAL